MCRGLLRKLNRREKHHRALSNIDRSTDLLTYVC